MESGRGHYLAIRAALSPKVFLCDSVPHTFAHKRFSVYQIPEAAHVSYPLTLGSLFVVRQRFVYFSLLQKPHQNAVVLGPEGHAFARVASGVRAASIFKYHFRPVSDRCAR